MVIRRVRDFVSLSPHMYFLFIIVVLEISCYIDCIAITMKVRLTLLKFGLPVEYSYSLGDHFFLHGGWSPTECSTAVSTKSYR